MDRPLTHRQLQELLGAYALDAVDDDEAVAVEAHLADCPRCRAEVAEHREAAALLGYVGAPAPEGVWDRIAAQLVTPEAPAMPGLSPAGAAVADLGSPRARPSRRSLPMRAVAGALAAAAVLVAVLGVQVVRMDRRLDRVLATVGERGLDQAVLAATADPSSRRVRLRSEDGSRVADAVLLPDGEAYLVSRRLPALTDAETYQLWAVVGDQKISVGVLGPDPSIVPFHYDGDPTVLAMTTERAGGVVASDKEPALVGFVPPRST
jgi:hypothetical protein